MCRATLHFHTFARQGREVWKWPKYIGFPRLIQRVHRCGWTSLLNFSPRSKINSFRIDQGTAHATGRLCPPRQRRFCDTKGATYGINNTQPAGCAAMSGFRVNGAFYAVSPLILAASETTVVYSRYTSFDNATTFRFPIPRIAHKLRFISFINNSETEYFIKRETRFALHVFSREFPRVKFQSLFCERYQLFQSTLSRSTDPRMIRERRRARN